MIGICQALAQRKTALAAEDKALSAMETAAREAQKENRPSKQSAALRKLLRTEKPRRTRPPKIYGRTRRRYEIAVENLILAQLEAREAAIAAHGFGAVIEEIRNIPLSVDCADDCATGRPKSPERHLADEIALRQIADAICDRLRAQFAEKQPRSSVPPAWSEQELRAVLRQRIALIQACIENPVSGPMGKCLLARDYGARAFYERLCHSNHLASKDGFDRIIAFLQQDMLVVPKRFNAEDFRIGWQQALEACVRDVVPGNVSTLR
jgi:hypothetical protein